MPAISAPNLAILRYKYHRVVNAIVDVYPLQSMGTATVDTLPASYPFADIPITGTGGGWGTLGFGGAFRPGQYVVIRDGSGNFVMDTVWRRSYNGTTLIRGLGISRGDSGKAVEQAAALAAGQSVTCYNVFIPKVSLSRIDSGIFYRRWDQAFTSFSASPQVNIGTHRAGTIDSGSGKLTLDFTLASSSTDWAGGTPTVTEWELPPAGGAAFVAPYTSTSNPTQIAFEPGAHIISCLSSGQRQFRYVWAHGDDGVTSYEAFSDTYEVGAPISDVETPAGRTVTFEVTGDNVSAALYTGAPCLFTYQHEYSNDGITWTTPTTGTLTESFFGHVRSFETISNDGNGVEIVRFTVVSPLIYAESLPYVAQYLIEDASPAEWWEIEAAYSHAGFIPLYVTDQIARFMIEMNDYYPGDGVDYFKFRWDIDADNLADAMRVAARPFLGNLGNVSDGALYLSRNPQLETDTNRNAVATVMTIADTDMYPPIAYQRNEVMPARETEGGAFIYSGAGTDAKIKGVLYRKGLGAPMQGTAIQTMPDFIALDTTEAASRVGHWHQRSNAPTPTISFEMPGAYDAFRLALMEWWDLNVATYDPMANGLYSNRILPVQVTRNWAIENGSLVKTLSVTAEPETYGQPAINRTRPTWNGQGITPSTAWTYTWDFLTAQGDWVEWDYAGVSSAAWTAGIGWRGDYPGNLDRVYISVSFASSYITSISFSCQTFVTGGVSARIGSTLPDGDNLYFANPTTATTHTASNVNQNLTAVYLGMERNTTTYVTDIITAVISGIGTRPSFTGGTWS